MKRIALLATGGTIASVPGDDGLAPGIGGSQLMSLIPRALESVELVCKDVFSLDSSNIQPEEWRVLAREVYATLDDVDGVVITHGTDTMAYSAASLTFMLRNVNKPVVFTGSQLPIMHPLSDAHSNLSEALSVAQTAPAGVYVVFNHKIINGSRAVKLRTTSFDAFDSINAPLVGYIDADGPHYTNPPRYRPDAPCTLEDSLNEKVFLLKLMPGTSPEIFDWVVASGMKGLVLEAFGMGGLHYIRRNLVDKLKMLTSNGVYTIVTTQCLYEKADFSIYEVGRSVLSPGHVFSGRDMTSEAAVAKLMWVLGDPDERLPLLSRSVRGEMHDVDTTE